MNLNVTASTIARTIILILALVNQFLSVFGIDVIPIQDETINSLVTIIFTIVAALVAWWKNNSFTKSAIQADSIRKDIKAGARVEYITGNASDVNTDNLSDDANNA